MSDLTIGTKMTINPVIAGWISISILAVILLVFFLALYHDDGD